MSVEREPGVPEASEEVAEQMQAPSQPASGAGAVQVDLKTVARRFGFLGMIAFGGPPAHVALMQVQTWRPDVVDDEAFASLFALTQCLPGPSSTQLAIALGVLSRRIEELHRRLEHKATARLARVVADRLVHRPVECEQPARGVVGRDAVARGGP